MSSGSVSQALNTLLKHDYVYIDKSDYYKLLDPLIKSALSDG